MSTSSNIRVSELAKELGLTSKDVIAKLAEIQIIVKTHSSSVTPDQCKRLKDYISGVEEDLALKIFEGDRNVGYISYGDFKIDREVLTW